MTKKEIPSMDDWLREAKAHESAPKIGMYLIHNGTVRRSARASVRQGCQEAGPVSGMYFACDQEKLRQVMAEARKMEGIYYIRAWFNEGELAVGDDIMYILMGGDIRPRVMAALDHLVSRIKNECVTEVERT